MSQKKTIYTRYLKIPCPKHGASCASARTFEVNKTYLCDMAKANACQKRAVWYGIETIGPRTYAVYRCADHKNFRIRLK